MPEHAPRTTYAARYALGVLEERDLLRTLMDNIPDAIYFKDAEGRFIRINQAQARRFGLSDPAQAAGKTDFDFFTEEHARPAYEDEQAILRSGQPLVGKEEKEAWPDGRVGWVSTTKMPLRDENGSIIGTFGISRDITERKRAEEALARQQYILDTFMENVPDHIYFKDLDSHITRANKAHAVKLGVSDPAEEIGKSDFDFFPEEQARAKYEQEQEIIRTGRPILALEEPSGAGQWSLTTKMPLRDEKGNIVGTFGISRDITERKQIEEELAQERNLLRSLIDHVPDYIYVKDTQSRFLIANPALARLIGAATPDELLGKTDFDFFPQELAAKFYADEQALFQSGQPVLELEEPTVDTAGNERWVSTTKVPLRDAQDKIFGLVGMGRDITERKRAEQEILQRNQELSTLNEIGRALSRLAEPSEILELIYTMVGRALDNRSFYIALYDEANQQLAFSIYTHNGQRLEPYTRPLANSISEYVIRTREPLLINCDVVETYAKLGIQPHYTRAPAPKSLLGVPMIAGGKVIGTIVVRDHNREYAYTVKHQELLSTIAAQAAIAIENARLYEDTKRRLGELSVLNEIDQAIVSTMEIEPLLQVIHTQVGRLMDNRNFYIALYDEATAEVSFPFYAGEDTSARRGLKRRGAKGITEHIIHTRQPILIRRDYTATAEQLGIQFLGKTARSWLGVPLLLGERVIGVMAVQNYEQEEVYDEEDLRIFKSIAAQAAIAVENARLFQETNQRAREFAALYDTSRDLSMQRDLPTLLQTIVERARTLLAASAGSIYLFDAARRDLEAVVATDLRMPLGIRLQLGEGMAGQVAQTREPMIVNDYHTWPYRAQVFEGEPITAIVEVPMLCGGELIGVLVVYEFGKTTRTFADADVRLLSLFAGQAASAVNNARLLEETQGRAHRQEALYRISTELARLAAPRELCEAIVRAVRDVLGYPYLGIFLLEPETGDRVLQAQSGWDDAPKDWRLHPGEGLSEKAFLTGELQYWPDVTREPRYVPGLRESHTELDVPIKIGNSVLGVLIVEENRVDAFNTGDFEVLRAVANQLAIALENARLFATVQQELTERKRAEEALVKRTNELEQAYQTLKDDQEKLLIAEKMASLGRLTAGIAHEMNTPLAAARASLVEMNRLVKEYQNSIGDPEITPDDHREIAQEMQQALRLADGGVERTANFVRGVKTQTRDLSPHERQRFNAVPVIQEALLLLSHALRKSGCTATFEPAVNYVELNGSPGRLAQVITNLVTNSIDASVSKGGGPITLQLTPRSNSIELEVSDSGSGIPPENLPRIFDPMFTTKPFGQGTGLGLTIVHDIVVGEFGGTIEVTSEPGQGATFRLEFPNSEGVT